MDAVGVALLYVSADGIGYAAANQQVGGPFVFRSLLLPLTTVLAGYLREQARSDIDLLARMLIIRRFDERLIALQQQKLVPGRTSPYIGQEAIAVGVAAELCKGRIVMTHEGGYSEMYAPYCGLAVIEELSGHRTKVDDPWGPMIAQWGGMDAQPHQLAAITEAARLVDQIS